MSVLRLGAEIDARQILDAHDRSVGIGAHNNVFELFGVGQPAFRRDRQLYLLALRRGRRADPAERGLHVLALHRCDNVRRSQVEGGQAVGVEPQPKRIIQRPEQARLPDAADPRQRVDDVDGRVVVQEQRVVRVLRRIDRHDLQQGRRFFSNDEPLPLHLLRQQGRGELGPVLHVYRVDIRIGAERKGDRQRVAAVGAARRLVIERIIDAVDLLLDRLRDGRLDDLRIGPGVKRRQRHLRRHDIRELRDRYPCHRNDPGERNDD